MKLSDLRRRIANAIAPKTDSEAPPPLTGAAWGYPPQLAPLDEAPIPPMPGSAVPLTAEQRENLEKLRDRYAPDRQKTGLDRVREAIERDRGGPAPPPPQGWA